MAMPGVAFAAPCNPDSPNIPDCRAEVTGLVGPASDGGGAGGALIDLNYVPPVPSAADLLAITAKAEEYAVIAPQAEALLATGITGPSYVNEASVPPCDGSCGSSPPPSAQVRMGFNRQEQTYYCVPATTQNILYGIRGVNYSQSSFAAYEGTTSRGTDARRMAPNLNANDAGRNTYQALAPAEVGSPTNLFSRTVTNVYRYHVGTGFTGDPAKMPWSARSETKQLYSHEIALYGYSNSGGGILLASEPSSATRQQFTAAQAWQAMSTDTVGDGWLTW
jgi:hypothetical protein